MEEKQIRKYLRCQFRPLGWSLVGYYLIMNIMVILSMTVESAQKILEALKLDKPVVPFGVLMNNAAQNAWRYLLAIAVGLTILLAWKGWDFFREEIFARQKKMRFGSFCAILCVFLGCQVGVSLYATALEALLNCMGLSAMTALEAATITADTVSMFLYASVVAPIVEEVFFRGFIQRSLLPFGKKFAVFGSALLFGMFHGNLIQTPYAFLVGLVLGYTAAEYNIWWAILLHAINNMVLADLLPRLLSFLPGMAGDIVMGCIIWAFAIASLIILIVKRREVKTYLRSECMDRRCLRGFFGNSGFVVMSILLIVNMLMMVTPV